MKPWMRSLLRGVLLLNLAEKRDRRKIGMPVRHPERIACFYRKNRWRALQRQLWPAGEWVQEIEADMRERGWRP